MPSRRTTLTALLVALAALAAAVLFEVLGTVVFAVTVAYVLAPIYRRVNDRLPPWWAATVTTVSVTLALFAVLGAVAVLLGRHTDDVLAALKTIPDQFAVTLFDQTVTVDVTVALNAARDAASTFAVDAARTIPTLGLKLTVFAFLVFALLIHHRDVEGAVLAAIPPEYHDVAGALGNRARSTLYAIYVLQAATGVGTFLIAVPVFIALGYGFPVTLALACGVLQFVPIVGPSVVVGALVLYHLAVGEVAAALLVLIVAGVLVAWLPDVLIRPRLARETANLPGSLYFVGFTGGLLTLGPIGIIAGPLAAALVAEATRLLAEER